MNRKSGLTIMSIVLYVVIFFALTILATGVTMAMNSSSLTDKGEIFVEEKNIKLKLNLLSSIKDSENAENISNKLIFSNNDTYSYDSAKKTIYKNGGILIQNVKNMSFSIEQENKKLISIILNASIEKYNQTKDIEILLFKGEV